MAVATQLARSPQERQAPNPPTGGVTYYRRLPESALTDRRLPRSALAVLGVLDGFARDKVECWPSVKTLTEASGYCRRAVQLALALLKTLGYVAEKEASNPTGRVLVLLWRTGAQTPTPRAQVPYSQGLPRGANGVRSKEKQVSEGRKGFSAPPSQIPEAMLPVSPRALEPRPTEAEKAEIRREWLEAVPAESPLARLLAGRLKA